MHCCVLDAICAYFARRKQARAGIVLERSVLFSHAIMEASASVLNCTPFRFRSLRNGIWKGEEAKLIRILAALRAIMERISARLEKGRHSVPFNGERRGRGPFYRSVSVPYSTERKRVRRFSTKRSTLHR